MILGKSLRLTSNERGNDCGCKDLPKSYRADTLLVLSQLRYFQAHLCTNVFCDVCLAFGNLLVPSSIYGARIDEDVHLLFRIP